MVSTSVVRQKVDLRRTFYFDTRIHPEGRGVINLFSICACSPVRFGTIWAKWKTGFTCNFVTCNEVTCRNAWGVPQLYLEVWTISVYGRQLQNAIYIANEVLTAWVSLIIVATKSVCLQHTSLFSEIYICRKFYIWLTQEIFLFGICCNRLTLNQNCDNINRSRERRARVNSGETYRLYSLVFVIETWALAIEIIDVSNIISMIDVSINNRCIYYF
jgi:hypothetical protein